MTKCDSCPSSSVLWWSFVSGDTKETRADEWGGHKRDKGKEGDEEGEGGEGDEGDSLIAAVWLDLKAAK